MNISKNEFYLIEYVIKVLLGEVRIDNNIKKSINIISRTFGPDGNGTGFDPNCEILYISGSESESIYEVVLGIEDYLPINKVQCKIDEIYKVLIYISENEPELDIDHGNGIVSGYYKKEAIQVLNYIKGRFKLELR